MAISPRIVRRPDGAIGVRLVAHERQILRAVIDDLRTVLAGAGAVGDAREADAGDVDRDPDDALADPALARLFPDARRDDPGASRRFRSLVARDLAEVRDARLAVVDGTLDARVLDDAQAEAWLGVINDARLVMGARLGVTAETDELHVDPDDPLAAGRVVYAYAGWLVEQLVDVLADALPDDEVADDAGGEEEADPESPA